MSDEQKPVGEQPLEFRTTGELPEAMLVLQATSIDPSCMTLSSNGEKVLQIDLKAAEEYIHISPEFLRDSVLDTTKGRTGLFALTNLLSPDATVGQLRQAVDQLVEGAINGFNRKVLKHPGLLAIDSKAARRDIEFAPHPDGDASVYVLTYRGINLGTYDPRKDGVIYDFIDGKIKNILDTLTMRLHDDFMIAFNEARHERLCRVMDKTNDPEPSGVFKA